MSGGHFNYDQFRIKSIAEEIQEYLDDMGKEKDDVDSFGMRDFYDKHPEERYNSVESEEVQEKMREAIKALKVAYIYAQRVDWYLSGDDGEENFLKRLEQELKDVNEETDETNQIVNL